MTKVVAKAVGVAGFLSLSLATLSQGAIVTVEGTSNIFAAGRATTTGFNPGGGGPGTVPTLVAFNSPTGAAFRFTSATGLVNCCGGAAAHFAGPDGAIMPSLPNSSTDVNSFAGISGLQFSNRQLFLVGVFLNDTTPTDPAPSRLSYSDTNADELSYTPGLNQTFFIGDGLTGTGSGTIQVFFSPVGATRLFLGFVDGEGFEGNPGWYSDNPGFLTLDLEVQNPEPATFVLFGLGLTSLVMLRKRSRRT